MNESLRAAFAVATLSLSLPALAVTAPAPAPPAAAASAIYPPAPPPACQAPGFDRAANHACAVAIARHAETERAAGRNESALSELSRADQFYPDDLRFAMTRAALGLTLAKQLSPAGIEAAARTAPDDIGLTMMHAELMVAKKDWPGAIGDLDRVLAKRPAAPMAWEMRAAANLAKPDFDGARADVEQALRIDPRSPVVLRLRGVLRSNAGDYAGAVADYQAARAIAPRPDDPFVIGSTQFLQRQFGDAAASLAHRPPPAPDGTYWRLWRYLALARLTGIERASGALGPGTPPGTGVVWPGPVVDYFHANIDAATLLDAAKKSQAARDLSQVCEAHFYMAEDALLRQRADAIALFRQVVGECPANFHEYEGAVAELRAAGVPLAAAAPAAKPAAAASAASAP